MKRASQITRARFFAGALALLAAHGGPVLGAAETAFDFGGLRDRAKQLAAKPYAAPAAAIPEWLRKLNYDEYRVIEFNAAQSVWRQEKLPFQVQFFHPGNLFEHPVQISELRDKKATPIPFRRELFNYRSLQVGALPDTLGFAGFKFLYALNGNATDELGSFLGASYFRMLCAKAVYGLSARGLALNTAEAGGEEFPQFTEFWLERPAAGAKSVTVYALLDSPSVTGAYQFSITPGADTVMQVKAVLFARKAVAAFGIAPLTSMFWRGENSNQRSEDFRPEVHDSDGLLMHTGKDEWVWRPLSNPAAVRVTSFADENPRAFGLLQRDRNFDSYQDLEASYQLRPSAWVEPIGQWGRGSVRLVEIPTPNEFQDNIVAFWVPEKAPAPGDPLELEYRLHWALDQKQPVGFTTGTRHGKSLASQAELDRFFVDFDSPELRREPPDAKLEPVLTVGPGAQLIHSVLQKNPANNTWRLSFTLKTDAGKPPVELRAALRKSSQNVTETWSYLWQP